MATVLDSIQRATTSRPDRLVDSHGRAITDLRISVTDRCNYKCVYCRTGNEGAVYAELPIDDYLRMARVFVGLGIEKVRLTGGEPLLRRGLIDLIRELGRLRTLDGQPLDLALTTNGHLLEEMAQPLRDAGLGRITVSMDAVDAEKFVRITRVPGSYERVLSGVRAAKAAGLAPVKVNCVLLRGFNEDQVVSFAKFSREEGVIVRFIEFMPLEEGRLWTAESVVSLREIVEALGSFRPLVRMAPERRQRDRRALHLRRRHRRNWHHRARYPGLLRPMQPRPPHLRRQDPHLPLLAERPRPLRGVAARRKRRRPGRVHSPHD